MENSDFSSFKYVVGNSFVHRHKVVVKVFFIYKKSKVGKRALSIEKKKNVDDSYYVDEAKKIIAREINSRYLAQFAGRNVPKIPVSKRLKVAMVTALSLAVVGTGSFYTYRYVEHVHQQEYMVNHVIEVINSLNPNSTEKEIKSAIETYEALPEDLEKSVPKETLDYLGKQIMLLEADKEEAKKVDDMTAELSILYTTELQFQRVDDRINRLTPRAHTLLREGTDKLIQDVKNAIEADKKKGCEVNDEILALEMDATWEQIEKVYTDIINLSTRAYSYITDEAKERITDVIDILEFEDEVTDVMMEYANAYSSEDPYTMCTIDDINTLKYVYTDLLYERTQQVADEKGFSVKLNKAIKMWNDDSNAAKTLENLATSLNLETCLDKDINAVKAKYGELVTNPRIEKLVNDSRYSESLAKAEAALQADKDATKKFYDETIGPIEYPNCSQADIDGVKAKYDAYYKSATDRLKILISSADYPQTNLDAKIKEAQKKYDEDFTMAKNLYDECVAKLTSDCTLDDIYYVENRFNKFLQDGGIRDRAKDFVSSGGPYDIRAKLNEAHELYDKDAAMADEFNQAMTDFPHEYADLSTEQKMIMASAYEYINKEPDAKHLYLNKRSKTLIKANFVRRLDSLMAEAEGKFKLTLEPKLNDDEHSFFTSDNVVKFNHEVGLYVEMTYTKKDVEYKNPRFTKIMGSASSSDYPRVFDPYNYNHVLSRVYVPNGVSGNLKIEQVLYKRASTSSDSRTVNPDYNNYVTIDVSINVSDFYYETGTYNGYTIGIKDQKDSDIGKVFKITGHYSEKR